MAEDILKKIKEANENYPVKVLKKYMRPDGVVNMDKLVRGDKFWHHRLLQDPRTEPIYHQLMKKWTNTEQFAKNRVKRWLKSKEDFFDRGTARLVWNSAQRNRYLKYIPKEIKQKMKKLYGTSGRKKITEALTED